MEAADEDGVFLHTLRSMPSTSLSSGGSSEPGQDGPETGASEPPTGGPPTLAQIEFRIQQLNNRRLLLQEIQRHIKKEEQDSGEAPQKAEVSDEANELKSIQREMQELRAKKQELQNTGAGVKEYTNGDYQEQLCCYKETPRGGVYMLPPPLPDQEVTAKPQMDSGSIAPVESLCRTAGVTKCPSCEEVVVTETHSARGEAVWILCFLCSIMGCVAGCCLVPFCLKRLRNIHHRCPQCQTNIHTHRPL